VHRIVASSNESEKETLMNRAASPSIGSARTGPAAAIPQSLRETMGRNRLILVVTSVILGMLLSSIDQTIVGTAMPRIIADLNGLEHYAWVATAYLLASTVAVPIWGKLSDIYGRKLFFIGGMVVFLLGSALSGMSQSMTELIFFRAIQGIGGGAMMPIALALIGDIFPPAERGKWQGLLMAVFGLSSIIGPTAGGWITDNWGWRWTFYVNMPIGAVALAVAFLALPAAGVRQQHHIDVWGSVALIAGTVPLLLAFSWAGTQYAWGSSQIIGLLVMAAVMLAVFVGIEIRVPEPIITPSLFTNSIFSISVLATVLTAAGMFGGIMYLPLFVQGVMGSSATNSGEVMTPMMLGFMVSSIVGGQILSRTGRYKILAITGFVIASIGLFLFANMTVQTTDAIVIRNMVITGLGIGVSMSLFTIVVQNAFPFAQLGQVTATLTFFRSMGSTIGIAVLGSVMTNRFQSALSHNLPAALTRAVPAHELDAFKNPQVLLAPGATDQIRKAFEQMGPQGLKLFHDLTLAIRVSLTSAITELFFVGGCAMILALVAVFFLREIPLRKGHSAPLMEGAADTTPYASTLETDRRVHSAS
jgi:EmrB/QacA subfamily drug resistance transporter